MGHRRASQMDWRNVIERFPSRLIERDGFSVRLYERFGVRYFEDHRRLTLLTGLEDATDRYGRSLLVFPTVETQIFVPTSLAWDSGERLTPEATALIIQRLCEVFAHMHRRYRVIVGDEIYNQQAADTSHS
jgi:hypothetical protein